MINFQMPGDMKMKERDLNYINIRSNIIKPRSKYTRIKQTVGLDTETIQGKAFLIGYYNNNQPQSSGILTDCSPESIITFLTRKMFHHTHNFFWNISYDFQAIIKCFPISNIKELAYKDRTIIKCNDKKYLINYLPNKSFSIAYNNKTVKFWDISQYYGKISLDYAAKKYLKHKGKVKLQEYGIDIANLSLQEYNDNSSYHDIINEYLLLDCKLTKELSQKIYNISLDYIIPKYFYSQASLSQQYFLENLKKDMFLPPSQVLQFANYAYQGGRFETIKRGFFDDAYIYDLKSAYPAETIKIPDTGKGKWKKSFEYDNDALISLFKVSFNFPENVITPTKAVSSKVGGLYFPYGKFTEMYINKKEYESISEYCNINIKKAYHYYDNEPEYPYMFLKKFYDLKEKFKLEGDTDMALFPKTVINGFYGKTIQQTEKLEKFSELRDKKYHKYFVDMNVDPEDQKRYFYYKTYHAGMLYNSVVANEITANTRMKLFNTAKKYENHVIGMQTDSIIFDKAVNIKQGNYLGDWDFEEKGELVILGSGVYSVKDGRNKMRGMEKGMDLFSVLKNYEKDVKFLLDVKRNNKLKKTFKQVKIYATEKDMYAALNLIIKEQKLFNLNFDKKRTWDRDFNSSKDVFESEIYSMPLIM